MTSISIWYNHHLGSTDFCISFVLFFGMHISNRKAIRLLLRPYVNAGSLIHRERSFLILFVGWGVLLVSYRQKKNSNPSLAQFGVSKLVCTSPIASTRARSIFEMVKAVRITQNNLPFHFFGYKFGHLMAITTHSKILGDPDHSVSGQHHNSIGNC